MRINGLVQHGSYGTLTGHGTPTPSGAETTCGLRRRRRGSKSLAPLGRPRRVLKRGDDPLMWPSDGNKRTSVVEQGMVVTVAGLAIVAGLAGCSNTTKSGASSTLSSVSSKASSVLSSVTASGSAASDPSTARVVIDGQEQNIQGTVTCATVDGNVDITIGQQKTGVTAIVSNGDPTVVHSVGLGTVNGVMLGYQEGVNQRGAQVTRDGNSYRITGTATGIDVSNPQQPVSKPFEIDVTCP